MFLERFPPQRHPLRRKDLSRQSRGESRQGFRNPVIGQTSARAGLMRHPGGLVQTDMGGSESGGFGALQAPATIQRITTLPATQILSASLGQLNIHPWKSILSKPLKNAFTKAEAVSKKAVPS
jgi:hypothetical protein